jgi:predicted site-specific integrase-resolvase
MARSKCLRKATALRAAQYIRMSTDHQKYSPINQADAINDYASGRGIKIVRTYADEGRSGLTFDYRPQLLDVLSKAVREQGYVSQAMIYKDKTMPSYFAYQVRFGGLERAYRLIGFTPKYARK